ncbi:ATP-dependent DNA helicase Q-like 3 [Olea europaea subsp. europaea]|uniref:ATP-dependent DNA helicase Q-like 3 n=1 Tax=Olea europaea subsp. europaea TaxID=158383 RepID=A0A8S0UXR9_OLEEU|nr:ATP-dependent DNA helicase Q-like 3 [Olea europaea subsp. europaea]
MSSSSFPRAPNSSWTQNSANNGTRPLRPQFHVLDVPPLNCVPYSGPPPGTASTPIDIDSIPSPQVNSKPRIGNHPAMVFMPSCTTNEEWNNILAATRSGIVLSGSAASGKMGPPIGAVDVGESEDKYVFRVALPGVSSVQNTFTCDFEPDGKVMIKGITSTGEQTVKKNNMEFVMLSQNLCPPGEFSISFQLPGAIDHQQVKAVFGIDGVFEGVVKKRQPSSF